MNRFDHQWQKLIVAARQAPADFTDAAPYGFATRVAAQAVSMPAAPSLERFALRALGLAALCSVAAVVFNFATLSSEQADIYATGTTGTTDTVVDLLDIS